MRNVLLVILDAARRDALEPYGAPPGSTQAIAQLASRGAALESVYATSSWTVPSHASIFTGLMPRAAGLAQVASPAAARAAVEAHAGRTLPEVMRRAGYSTDAVSANLWISDLSGFDRGFDRFEQIDSRRHARIHGGRRDRLRWLVEAGAARADDGAEEAERKLEAWIAERPRNPFFWFVNLIECHSPYLPPRPFQALSLRERLRAADDARRYYRLEEMWHAAAQRRAMPPAALERMRRLYDASIRYMDAWLGRLLERLDQARLLDDTVVIVASDHGENFGEGGLVAHGLSLDNQLIHVPFVVAGADPGTAPITSLASLPRFITEAAGAGAYQWPDGPPEGIGVAQLDARVDLRSPGAAAVAAGWGYTDEELARLTTPLTCAVAGNLKLLRRGGREEVYDLRSDPAEVAPLDPDRLDPGYRDDIARLRAALEHHAVRSEQHSAAAEAARAPDADELAAIESRMKLLGYM